MRAGHVWLLSLLLLPFVGAPLIKHPAFRAFSFATRAVLAGAVGAVLLSLGMTAFALAGLRWGPVLLLVSVAGVFLIRLALPRGDTGDVTRASAENVRPAVRIGYAITALAILAALAATVAARATSPDLVLFWGAKAQRFAAARTVDTIFLTTQDLDYLHVYYPPLVTNLFAFGATMAGRFPWGAATLTFPLCLAATAVGVVGILRTGASAAAAAATTAVITSALALLGIEASVAGNAEPFLLFFEVLALALLLSPIARGAPGQLLAGLLLAGAAAAKVEGLPFLVTAVALFFVVEPQARRRPLRTAALLVGPAALSLGAWFTFGATRRVFYGYQGYGRFLDLHVENLPEVIEGLGRTLWKAGYALPFLVPLALFVFSGPKTRRALLPLGVAVVLTGFLVFTYLHGANDPRQWIDWSGARVMAPVSALLALGGWCSRSGQP